MKFKDLQKRAICMFMALLMAFTAVPVNSFLTTAHAAQEDGLCAHHTTHGECGYAEAVAEQPCLHIHDSVCGYVEDTEGSLLCAAMRKQWWRSPVALYVSSARQRRPLIMLSPC